MTAQDGSHARTTPHHPGKDDQMNRPQNNPQTRTATLATVIAALMLIATGACGDGTGSPTGPSPTRPTGSLRIDGLPAVGIEVGQTVQLTATIIASDGATRTAPASWSTTSPERLDITQQGQATGKLPGQARITAEAEGLTRHADTEVHDPRLDDQFWREFAFDDWECTVQRTKLPNYCDWPVEERALKQLPIASPNLEIVTGTLSENLKQLIRRAMPEAAQQLTGQTYTGLIQEGPGTKRDGWLVIEGAAGGQTTKSPGCGAKMRESALGASTIGSLPGCIILNTTREHQIGQSTVMHEIGHAMGFHHVGDVRSIMSINRDKSFSRFSFKEQKHGQFAYGQPRGATYAEISLNSFGLQPPQPVRGHPDQRVWVYD
ncbi:MAG: hypothetical protein OXC00_13650 [Acidimicrobiaceae bacterium]|nr:hypothetical protein [Acidimicrobiaceae bacterium]